MAERAGVARHGTTPRIIVATSAHARSSTPLEVPRALVSATIATADEETGEGAGDEVEERPHRPSLAGLSDRESGFPIPTAPIEPQIHPLIEAYEIDPNERIARALRIAHHELTGERMVAVGSRATGNAGDFVHEAHIPAVYYGCSYPTAHSDDEQVFVPELARVAAGYALASAHFLSADAELAAPPLETLESAG